MKQSVVNNRGLIRRAMKGFLDCKMNHDCATCTIRASNKVMYMSRLDTNETMGMPLRQGWPCNGQRQVMLVRRRRIHSFVSPVSQGLSITTHCKQQLEMTRFQPSARIRYSLKYWTVRGHTQPAELIGRSYYKRTHTVGDPSCQLFCNNSRVLCCILHGMRVVIYCPVTSKKRMIREVLPDTAKVDGGSWDTKLRELCTVSDVRQHLITMEPTDKVISLLAFTWWRGPGNEFSDILQEDTGKITLTALRELNRREWRTVPWLAGICKSLVTLVSIKTSTLFLSMMGIR